MQYLKGNSVCTVLYMEWLWAVYTYYLLLFALLLDASCMFNLAELLNMMHLLVLILFYLCLCCPRLKLRVPMPASVHACVCVCAYVHVFFLCVYMCPSVYVCVCVVCSA